jgi:formylglycine-generating enzyme required for sulfatase activity
MAVLGASWKHPYGSDSFRHLSSYPVTQMSYQDASEYCNWAGRRLPNEVEWEFASRGGFINMSYPWGNKYLPNSMNIWEGNFPQENTGLDGFIGVAPVRSYQPNSYGVYNTLGNVWEWVEGGSKEMRIMRGGSYIDSVDGSFNHPVLVSTRQENSGDSASTTSGFRCAYSEPNPKKILKSRKNTIQTKSKQKNRVEL